MFSVIIGEVKTMAGGSCILPFYISGTEYFECFEYGMDTYCPVEVNDDGWEGYLWGKCGKGC